MTVANIVRDLRGERRVPFTYKDKGSMATIGRNGSVALIGGRQLSGYVARLITGDTDAPTWNPRQVEEAAPAETGHVRTRTEGSRRRRETKTVED